MLRDVLDTGDLGTGGHPDPDGGDEPPRPGIPAWAIAAIVAGFIVLVGGWALVVAHGAAEDRALRHVEAVAQDFAQYVAAAEYDRALAEICEPERQELSTSVLERAHAALGPFTVEGGTTGASRVPAFTLRPRSGQAGLRVTLDGHERTLVVRARRDAGTWCVVADRDDPIGRLG